MQVEHPVCCGIDVHKDTLTAWLRRVDANGQVNKEGREFATTYTSLLALSDWLVEQHCPVVAMESTGVYWKPVYHVLAGTVEVFIGNAHELRSRPGKKRTNGMRPGSPSSWPMGSSGPALCRLLTYAPCGM